MGKKSRAKRERRHPERVFYEERIPLSDTFKHENMIVGIPYDRKVVKYHESDGRTLTKTFWVHPNRQLNYVLSRSAYEASKPEIFEVQREMCFDIEVLEDDGTITRIHSRDDVSKI